jgi:hypothetical protein
MKKIAPVYFGVTDNRSRVTEESYIDAKRRRDAVQEIFAEEIRMERRKKIHVTNVRIIVMLHASDFAISR